MNVEEIKAYIDSNRDNIVRDLGGLIAIPSISSDQEQVHRALDYVLNLARSFGLNAESVLDKRVGVISFGEGDETVGILSHVDVVPVGNEEAWRTPPFEMVESGGNLYGRGTLDDKGATIASLYAMKYLVDCCEPVHKKVQLILGTQEEVEWSDINAYVKSYPLPDYGFTPDGEFPLCNIEKGGLQILMEIPLDQPQNDGWYLADLTAGYAANAVPGTCIAKIVHYRAGNIVETREVKTEGKSAHACQPEKGINAILLMADVLMKENLEDNQLLCGLKMLRENFSDIFGRKIGLYSESEYYNGEFVHRNTFTPTMVYLKGGYLHAVIDNRYPYGASPAQIAEQIILLAEEMGGRGKIISELPAVYVSRDKPFLRAFGEAYEEGSGRKHEFILAYGGSYAKAMPNIVSWGPIFPGEEDTCHEENEYIPIDTLLDNGKIFAIALAKVALSKQSFK